MKRAYLLINYNSTEHIKLTKSCPKKELVPVPQKHVPNTTGNVQRHGFGKYRIDPIQQVEVGRQPRVLEVQMQLGQIVTEQFVVDVVIRLHLQLVQSEGGQMQGPV